MPFPELPGRLAEVYSRIERARTDGGRGQQVVVVAVTKTHGPEAVEAAWAAGLRNVGENRVQEAVAKMDETTVPVAWHLIGHLQRNKVKFIDRFALTHSIDSMRLAEAVDAHAHSTGRRYPVLVQVNASGEATKGGFDPDSLRRDAEQLRRLDGLEVRGTMTMAPLDADEATLRATFRGCREGLERLGEAGHAATELSMGMSSDFEIAVEEGATMVRLGTVLFGARMP